MKPTILSIIIFALSSSSFASELRQQWRFFQGICDASAVEMLDDEFFVVGNDEDNVLRIYSRLRGGPAVQELDFSAFYQLKKTAQEIDLEGAARVGDLIFWVSSHGANKNGKLQLSRRRFFATRVRQETNGLVRLEPYGRLYTELLSDLFRDPLYSRFNLELAARKPPKATGALNIEGLAPGLNGALFIGFRNPIPNNHGLIAPMLNPAEVIRGQRAKFGPPVLLNMNGLGIRSITPHSGGYLVVAGSSRSAAGSLLYFWDGKNNKPQLLTPSGLAANPEAISVFHSQGQTRLFVVSDDGTESIVGQECKRLKNDALKRFRAYELTLE
jgi:hypothetical protein